MQMVTFKIYNHSLGSLTALFIPNIKYVLLASNASNPLAGGWSASAQDYIVSLPGPLTTFS